MTTSPDIGPERTWMAAVHESAWHAVNVSTGDGAPIAECGHRLRGPVHRRLGKHPPAGDGRVVCAACRQALPSQASETTPTTRSRWLAAVVNHLAYDHASIAWPPDETTHLHAHHVA